MIGFAAIYGIFCTGLNFFMGYTGQASFGQNAFAALGGYGTAILTRRLRLASRSSLLVIAMADLRRRSRSSSAIRPCGCAATISPWRPSRSASSPTRSSVEWTSLTQGYMGYSGIPPLGVGNTSSPATSSSSSRSSPSCCSASGSRSRLRDSRFGRALRAIAGSEAAANALGIDVARYKLAAFVVAALYASVAGSLFAHFVGFISPEVFGTLDGDAVSFTMLYLGGIGTIWGPIIGAVIVSLLPSSCAA